MKGHWQEFMQQAGLIDVIAVLLGMASSSGQHWCCPSIVRVTITDKDNDWIYEARGP